MAKERPPTNVPLGEFPFPLADGPKESRYLTWIRNHSNYMAAQGLSDYSRIVGILLRGVLVNLLIFVPYLLAVSLAVAAASFLDAPRFLLTRIGLGLFAVWTVLFLVATPLFRIARYRMTRATGSDSSVKQRDVYERSFGVFLLAILAIAALESLPGMLDAFHDLIYGGQLGWPAFATTAAALTAVFGVAPSLLSLISAGLIRNTALMGIGALGIVVPLFFVLFAADFLVFGARAYWTRWAVLASVVLPAGIVVAALLGLARRAWRPRDYAILLLLVLASFALYRQLNSADLSIYQTFVDAETRERDEALIGELQRNPEKLGRLASDPDLKTLADLSQLHGQLHELRQHRDDAGRRGPLTLAALRDLPPPGPADASPGGADGAWALHALAEASEGAGLYDRKDPKFDQAFGALKDRTDACGGSPEACAPLRRVVHHLSASAAFVRELSEASTSHGGLATHVVTLRREVLEGMRVSAGHEDHALLLEVVGESNALLAFEYWTDLSESTRYELVGYLANRGSMDSKLAREVRGDAFWPKFYGAAMLAILLWAFCWLTIDVNLTSIHGLYRDRLASAFLVGEDTRGDVDIEKDLDLMELCNHAEGSRAPYHLINVALNLQGSSHIGIRDRNSDFFVFSKRFIGGRLTGYCRSETMERVFPQMDLATAMAISAAAASPNMGRATSPALTAVMTLLNIRLGYWVPNPGLVEEWEGEGRRGGFSFEDIFRVEQNEIAARWQQLERPDARRFAKDGGGKRKPHESVEHGLVGIAFSGGGIRSATMNLGITQALHEHGVFEHADYMSTVSGGGYLGSSISALMRSRPAAAAGPGTTTAPSVDSGEDEESAGQLFRWRVRPIALVREIFGKVHEKSRLVNVSDGGHIENLAGIELLRRHCRYLIIGDGEADEAHHFNGLATLIQTARIDLGIHIEIDVTKLRRNEKGLCESHFALGRTHYPGEGEPGYLLYLKSSVTGEEDEVITNYRSQHPAFPHETTADQMFSEGQFEAYRSLGQHIGETVLAAGTHPMTGARGSYEDLGRWFEGLASPGESAPTVGRSG